MIILGGLFFWVAMAFVVGVAASSRGRSGVAWFLVSLFVTPIITGLLVLALPSIDRKALSFEHTRDSNFRGLESFHEKAVDVWEHRAKLTVKLLFFAAVIIGVVILYFDNQDRGRAQQQSANPSLPVIRGNSAR